MDMAVNADCIYSEAKIQSKVCCLYSNSRKLHQKRSITWNFALILRNKCICNGFDLDGLSSVKACGENQFCNLVFG